MLEHARECECRTPDGATDAPTFNIVTTAQPLHQRALALAQAITP